MTRTSGRPKSTLKYCLGLWKPWVSYMVMSYIDSITEVSKKDLNYWHGGMSNRLYLQLTFIGPSIKKDREKFTPNYLHHMSCGIMRF